MKFNFSMIKAMVFGVLGVKSFNKDEAGRIKLSEEEREKIKGAYGEEFANKFAEYIASDAAGDETSEESIAAATGMINAIRTSDANQIQTISQQLAASQQQIQQLTSQVARLSEEPETPPKPEGNQSLTRKPGVATVMKVNTNLSHYQAAISYLQSGSFVGAANATIDVLDLKNEFGTFLSQNQNNLEIIRQLFQDFTSAKYFRTVVAATEYRAVQALINSVVQQFSPKWTPAGNTKFTPLTIKNRRHKINVSIIPAQVLDSYLLYLYDEGLSPDQMPITKYIWNSLVYPKILDDIELRMIGKGQYVEHEWNDITPGGAGAPPEDGMDGLETILVAQKALGNGSRVNFFTPSGSLSGFNWATATPEQIIAFVEAYVDWISPFYRNRAMNIFLSPENYRRYQRAYKKVWGMNSGQSGDFGTARVDYSLQTLVPLDCLYGSPIMFCTPAENMVKLRYKNDVPQVINDVQKHDYEVRLYGEFWFAVGFAIAEAIFAYVPDGYDPQAVLTSTYGASTKFLDGSDPRTESDIYEDMPGAGADSGSSAGSGSSADSGSGSESSI